MYCSRDSKQEPYEASNEEGGASYYNGNTKGAPPNSGWKLAGVDQNNKDSKNTYNGYDPQPAESKDLGNLGVLAPQTACSLRAALLLKGFCLRAFLSKVHLLS